MAQKIRKTSPKKIKNNSTSGIVHIQSTFNNTIVTITNIQQWSASLKSVCNEYYDYPRLQNTTNILD